MLARMQTQRYHDLMYTMLINPLPLFEMPIRSTHPLQRIERTIRPSLAYTQNFCYIFFSIEFRSVVRCQHLFRATKKANECGATPPRRPRASFASSAFTYATECDRFAAKFSVCTSYRSRRYAFALFRSQCCRERACLRRSQPLEVQGTPRMEVRVRSMSMRLGPAADGSET